MTKNNRLLLSVSIVITYTFLSGVVKQYSSIDKVLFSLISLVVISVVIFLSVNVMLRFGVKYVKPGDKHNEDMTGVGAISLFPATIAVFLYSLDMLSGRNLVFLYIIIGVVGVYLLASYILDYVIMKEESIEGRYLVQWKTVEIRYDEIEEIRFSDLLNNLVITGNGKKVYLDVALVDAKMMLNTLTSKVNEEIYKEAFERLAKYYRFFKVQSNIEELDYFKKEL